MITMTHQIEYQQIEMNQIEINLSQVGKQILTCNIKYLNIF